MPAHFLQIVHREQVHAQAVADGRVEVAGNGQVQHQQRPLIALRFDAAEIFQTNDRLGRSGGRDDHVGFGQGVQQLVPGPGAALPSLGQLFGPIQRAVHHGDVLGPFVGGVAERLFGHFAGADDEHLLVVEAFENLLGELGHGHAGHADPLAVDGGFVADASGGFQRGLEHGVRDRSGRLAAASQVVGLFDLGSDLRFADHHAVQPGGHHEQVHHRFLAAAAEQLFQHLVGVQLVESGQELAHLAVAEQLLGAFGRRVELHPVASGQDHGFHLGELPAESGQGLLGFLRRESQLLPQLHRRVVMAAAHQMDHGCGPSGKLPMGRIAPSRSAEPVRSPAP